MACQRSAHAQRTSHLDAARHAVLVAHARADSLHAIASADSARAAHVPVIRRYAGLELRADSLIIPTAYLRALDSAFVVASGEARALLGSAADTMLTGVVISAVLDGVPSPTDGRADSLSLRVRGPTRFGHRYVEQDARQPDIDALRGMFAGWYEELGGRTLPYAIQRWAEPRLPVRAPMEYVYTGAYVRLAMVQPGLWRACMEESHGACRAALAMVANGDTINAWYSVEQQREAITRAYGRSYPYQAASRAALKVQRECVPRWATSECRRDLPSFRLLAPTSGTTRLALLRIALAHGGPEGFQRLVTAESEDVAAILELTARVPIDSLITEWRANVIAAQPPSPTPTGAEFATSLALSALVLGIAMRRRP